MMQQAGTLFWLALGVINVGWLALLGWRLLIVPDNHWAFAHPRLVAVFAAELAWCCIVGLGSRSRRGWRGWRGWVVVTAFLALVVTAASLCFGGLLPYNEWIRRGMPQKWDW